MKLTAAMLLVVVLLTGCSSSRTGTFPNGSTYTGEFKGSKLHGQGTMTLEDGTKAIGEWKDDRMHGQFTMTSPDGKVTFTIEYKDGERVQGTTRLISP